MHSSRDEGFIVLAVDNAILVNLATLFVVELVICKDLANDVVLIERPGPPLRYLILDLILYYMLIRALS